MFGPCTSSESRGSLRVGRLLSASGAVLALLSVAALNVGDAAAQHIVINNGLAPPNPDNVIDSSADPTLLVLVRNVGCPPSGTEDYGLCPSPGAPTEAEIVAGADLPGGSLANSPHSENAARDSSVLTVSGGTVDALSTRENARATVTDGTLFFVKAYDDSVLTFSGGWIRAYLEVWDNATVIIRGGTVGTPGGSPEGDVFTVSTVPVTVSGGSFTGLRALNALPEGGGFLIQGNDFALNGVPADYGDYPRPETSTTLTGTWESGENFSVPIQSPFTLAPPVVAVPALPILPALGLAATLAAIGASRIRNRRAA